MPPVASLPPPPVSLGAATKATRGQRGPSPASKRIKLALMLPQLIDEGATSRDIAKRAGVSNISVQLALQSIAATLDQLPAIESVGLRTQADIAIRHFAMSDLRNLVAMRAAIDSGEDVDPTRLRNCLARIRALLPMIRGERTESAPLDAGQDSADPEPDAPTDGFAQVSTRF